MEQPREQPPVDGRVDPVSLGGALMAGKKVAPDVTALLMEDHRTVLGWFDWYASEDSRVQKARILASILKALAAHMVGEEDFFYPEAARCIRDPALVDRARREHDHAKAIMAQLQAELPNPAESLVSQLRAEIETHVQEEETQLFPLVRESGMDLYRIGALFAARRVETLLEIGALASNPSIRSETAVDKARGRA
jgi:hemerythrin superfamily protein